MKRVNIQPAWFYMLLPWALRARKAALCGVWWQWVGNLECEATAQRQYLNRLDSGERDTVRIREGMAPERVSSGGGGNGLDLRNGNGGMTDSLTIGSCFTTEAAKTDRVVRKG